MITTASLGRALAEQAGATWADRDYDQGFYERQAAKALARAAELDKEAGLSQEDGGEVATTEAIRALLNLPADWDPTRVLDAARWWIATNVRPEPEVGRSAPLTEMWTRPNTSTGQFTNVGSRPPSGQREGGEQR